MDKKKIEDLYATLNVRRDFLHDRIRFWLYQSMDSDYIDAISEIICDDVAQDIAETRDPMNPHNWGNGDLHLSIGRVILKRLGGSV